MPQLLSMLVVSMRSTHGGIHIGPVAMALMIIQGDSIPTPWPLSVGQPERRFD
ncbi:hypothetical protein [Pseudomonas profundi]|uniref:hypothetical protein n=1 Tax=Pseudomonas profundi TaxID=1981513 RepID=UPI0016811310|nr:hypothetical protein [Pseudomonas profundi]